MIGAGHKQRIITGLALAAALVTALAFGGMAVRVLVCGAAVLALWELYQMFWPGWTNLAGKAAGLLCGAAITLGIFPAPGGFLALLAGAALFTALRFTLLYGQGKGSGGLQAELPLVFGLIYIPLSLQFALSLGFSEQMLAILAAAASDTGAYYAGSLLGKHKICPAVSPNKSWEGFAGGIAADMVILTLYGSLVFLPGMEGMTAWQWALAGAAFSLAAQFGDFFESALKRAAGVKDSSALLPGHGGLLDRLDSILFTLPAYALLQWLF